MNLKIKIGVALAAVLLTWTLGSWAWSSYRTAKLEKAVVAAKTEADTKTRSADESEKRSAEYAAKTEYLEQKLVETSEIARKQNEELEKLKNDTAARRNDAARARSVRSIAATADELCERLAEIGHPCQ